MLAMLRRDSASKCLQHWFKRVTHGSLTRSDCRHWGRAHWAICLPARAGVVRSQRLQVHGMRSDVASRWRNHVGAAVSASYVRAWPHMGPRARPFDFCASWHNRVHDHVYTGVACVIQKEGDRMRSVDRVRP